MCKIKNKYFEDKAFVSHYVFRCGFDAAAAFEPFMLLKVIFKAHSCDNFITLCLSNMDFGGIATLICQLFPTEITGYLLPSFPEM